MTTDDRQQRESGVDVDRLSYAYLEGKGYSEREQQIVRYAYDHARKEALAELVAECEKLRCQYYPAGSRSHESAIAQVKAAAAKLSGKG